MCKLLVIPKVLNHSNVKKFVIAARPTMTYSDNHGIGYSALTSQGLAVERWTNVKQAFKPIKHSDSAEELLAMRPLASVLEDSEDFGSEYNTSGPITSAWKSVSVHSRYATCAKGIENTHPFVSGTTAINHNGIIQNPDAYGARESTCDSEVLLKGYLGEGMVEDSLKVQNISDNLKGYFAFTAISQRSDGVWVLDIVKDNSAQLHCAYIPKLGTAVFATTPQIIKDACKKLKWKCGSIRELKSSVVIRFNASTGELIETVEFVRESAIRIYTPDVSRALGFNAKDDEFSKYSPRDTNHALSLAGEISAEELEDFEELEDGTWGWRGLR